MPQSKLSGAQTAMFKRIFEFLARMFGYDLRGVDVGEQLQTVNEGVIPAARVKLSAVTTNNDTITIGGHVFKFVTALGAADTFTQIKIGASAAADRANLVKAINGTADADNITPATTPFKTACRTAGYGLVADDVGSGSLVRIRETLTADGHGKVGSVGGKTPTSITLAASLSQSGDGWLGMSNINHTGKAPGKRFVQTQVSVTTALINSGSTDFYVELPFTPTSFLALARSSAGVLRSASDVMAISNSALKVTFGGSTSPNLQNGDVLTLFAWE